MDVNGISKVRFEVEGIESVQPVALLADGSEAQLDLTFGDMLRRSGKLPFEFLTKDGSVKRRGTVFFRAREDEQVVSIVVNDDLGTRFSDRETNQPFKMAIDGQYD